MDGCGGVCSPRSCLIGLRWSICLIRGRAYGVYNPDIPAADSSATSVGRCGADRKALAVRVFHYTPRSSLQQLWEKPDNGPGR